MKQDFRLIKYFAPMKYSLAIDIQREKREFKGQVSVEGTTQPNSKNIKLNAAGLTIESVQVDGHAVQFTLQNDILDIESEPGEHIATIDYRGKITDDMYGMYPCYYQLEGQKKELIATQFESCHAREAFPCVDEPEAKAQFDVSLTTEPDVVVLGNMPVRVQHLNNNRLTTKFETTPIMSSYLVAWVYGDLYSKTTKTKDGIDISVWATKAQSPDRLDFALDIAKRSIEFYEDYFDIKYPLPKSDQVALPDFAAGAMENWGLVTYRESALLVDPKLTPVADKQYIATVITHELSHQWFGDLVTMKWWNDLWLNESFASIMESKAADVLEPTWDMWMDFNQTKTLISLQRDSLDGVQPVRIAVDNPSEISSIFDGAIVYAKGARLIKTLMSYVGEDNFRKGLHNYFKKFAYKNTADKDLWQCLSEVSHKNIAKFMDSWLNQPGFPVLNVDKVGDKLELSQTRLVNQATQKSNQLWPILLNTNLPNAPELMESENLSLEIPTNFKEVIRFNIGNSAHFITNYSDELLSKILEKIRNNELEPIDRLQILNEQCILAESGIISNEKLVDILLAYKDEQSETVWSIMSKALGLLKVFTHGNKDMRQDLRKLAKMLVEPQFKRLGWNEKSNETPNDTKLRSLTISWMLYSRDEQVIKTAIDTFNSKKINELDPETRGLLIGTTIYHEETAKLVNNLFDLYAKTESTDLQSDICYGLTETKNNDTIQRILSSMFNKDIIKPQDMAFFFVHMMRNSHARTQTWQWLKDQWPKIKEVFAGDGSYDVYPRYAAYCLSKQDELDDYISFFTPMINDPSLSRNIKIGINEMTNRIKIIDRDSAKIAARLKDL